MPSHRSCRICGKSLPPPFFDLGLMPLANAFLAPQADRTPEDRFPLALAACRQCGLVQLDFVVPAATLYRDYIYVSSTSDGVRVHTRALASRLASRYGLSSGDLVVEIASNDGTALQAFRELGLSVLGVEPARNIAAIAEAAGVATIPEFFTAALGPTVTERHGRASVVLARHVFAHVNDVHDFLEGVEHVLDDSGVLVIEVPYLGDLLANREFDTVYHEHLSYFALTHFALLAEAHGLHVVDVEHVGLHGGSIVVHMQRGPRAMSAAAQQMLADEAAQRWWSEENLVGFGNAVADWKRQFENLIAGIVRDGGSVAGYGAAAKGNTLLNYCPSVASALSCILDRSPHKQGRLTPGTHIPVRPVEAWKEAGPTHLLLLAWNFKDEIMRQMAPFATQGGRFVVPLPSPIVV